MGSGADSRFWPAVVDRVLRRPVVSLALAVAVLVALPALGLHVYEPTSDNIPKVPSSLQARITRDFPGTSAPAIVAYSWPAGERAQAERAAQRLQALADVRGVAPPSFSPDTSLDDRLGTLELPLSGSGHDAARKRALAVLRGQLVPQTLGHVPDFRWRSPATPPATSVSAALARMASGRRTPIRRGSATAARPDRAAGGRPSGFISALDQ